MNSKPTNVRWSVFALACGTSWLLYLHRYLFALIKPELRKEWGLEADQLGYLDSAFSFCYSVFQFPLGVVVDVAGAHLVLTLMILVWSIGLALHALAPNLGVLWYARATLGLGQSAVFAAQNRITRTWFAGSIRTTVQGWVGVFSGRIGGMSANLLFATVLIGVLGLDWRSAVYLLTAVGLVQACLFFFVFRNSPRKHPWVNAAEVAAIEDQRPSQVAPLATQETKVETDAGNKTSIREMLRMMSPRSIVNLLCLNLQSILSTVADNIFSNWIPLFLSMAHGLEFKEMGIYSALPLLGGALGGAMGGYLNDVLIRRTGNRRWSRTGIALTGKGLAAALMFTALAFYDNPYVFCVLLFFVKFFGDWSLSTSWGTISDIGGRATASVFAFNNSVAGIGAIAAPTMYGLIIKHSSWSVVFTTAGIAYILCALSWLLVNCTIPLVRETDAK